MSTTVVKFALAGIIISSHLSGGVIGMKVGEYFNTKLINPIAIENGCAQYNPKTGDFEWMQVQRADTMIMNDQSILPLLGQQTPIRHLKK